MLLAVGDESNNIDC
ncbi:BnaA02g12500D [Brassica napus]|uniref:BnaA02g12500D protein n=3 Tax=Brassica TaxID=3705 RepID=A0A078FTW1_BRANA|nr:BnaA02g12500D [Brassica napus]